MKMEKMIWNLQLIAGNLFFLFFIFRENRYKNFPSKSQYIQENAISGSGDLNKKNVEKTENANIEEPDSQSPVKSIDDFDFKQIPKNKFANTINYNNYYFGNNNPKDLKIEDFDVKLILLYHIILLI